MPRHIVSLICALVLVVAACSGDEPAADSTTSIAPTTSAAPTTTEGDSSDDDEPEPEAEPELDPLAEVVTGMEIDPETGEPVEVEEVVGPTTYDQLLEAGIDAGLWDELEGLELLLGHAVGAVPSDQVPGTDFLLAHEFTDLLVRAHAYSLSDEYTEQELEQVRRWYELAVPGPEAMTLLETTSTNVNIDSLRSWSSAQTADCAPVDADDFSDWAVVEGCYLMWAESVQGVTVRVFYPAWYEDDPANAGLPLAAGQALVQSINTFGGFAPVGDIDAIFSLVDTAESDETLAVANDDATWGEASRGGACPISLFPSGFASDFEKTLAHEAWHCVQREMGFPRGTDAGTSWFVEGGAEYFANLVFPDTGFLSTFDSNSRTTPLFDMGYEAWVWWQFLGSREGPGGVANLHKAMSDAGDGGRALMTGRGEQFERFVIEYVAGAIEGPVSIPPASTVNLPRQRVGKDDEGKELEFVTGQFTAARYLVRYDQELRVFESDQSPGDVRMAMVEKDDRFSPDAWREVFPEIRSKCKDSTFYLVAATSETPASQSGTIEVDKIEEAVCDPCVLGTWSLDLASFEDMIKSLMGSAMPPGADFTISGGAYYFAFDEEGKLQEQRDGLTITVSAQGFSMDIVIDSFGTGEYTADGDNIGVTNLQDLFVEVTMSGFSSDFDSSDFAAISGSGTYECNEDDMEITIPEGTTRWVRVDKILEPPPLDSSGE